MEKRKYSCIPCEPAVEFLLANGIRFIHTKDFQKGRMRLFFYATDEQAEALREETHLSVVDECDGWGFASWELLK